MVSENSKLERPRSHLLDTLKLDPEEKNQGILLGLLAVIAMTAGLAQNVILTFFPTGAGQLLDDLVVVLLAAASVFRWGRTKAIPALLAAMWVILLGMAFYQTTIWGDISNSDAFVLFRQVFIPATLIMVGLVFTPREWKLVCCFTILFGVCNAIYGFLEALGIRLIDPAPLGHFHEIYVAPDGLPGYYHGIWLDGTETIRTGGLLLNPPTTGIAIGASAVLVFFVFRGRWKNAITALLLISTALTGSRAGMLIALVGISLPFLVRKVGAFFAVLIVAVPIAFTASVVSGQGGSVAHVQGLVAGLRDAVNFPLGRGFGHNGNHANSLGLTESSESLLGIAFSAAGIMCVIITILLFAKMTHGAFSNSSAWLYSLGIGLLAAALLSETAGAINGTVPIWIFIGYAISGRPYPKNYLDNGTLNAR